MKRPPIRIRWPLLLAALAGAAWLAAYGDKTPTGDLRPVGTTPVGRPAPATQAVPRPATSAATTAIEAIVPRAELLDESGAARVDLFAPVEWTPSATPMPDPPPPPPAAGVAEAVELAPTLPYRVIGKKIEGEQWEVFLELEREGSIAIARGGVVLDGAYRVERIDPPTMSVTHVPSGRGFDVPIGPAR